MALPANTGLILQYIADRDAWPNVDPVNDWTVLNGASVAIINWNRIETQPTEQQIIDAELEAGYTTFLADNITPAEPKWNKLADEHTRPTGSVTATSNEPEVIQRLERKTVKELVSQLNFCRQQLELIRTGTTLANIKASMTAAPDLANSTVFQNIRNGTGG